MLKPSSALLLFSALSSISLPLFAETAFDRENFSANVAITSNYLFRGITASGGESAISGGVDWSYKGFYAGTWASSISAVETESFEIDYYLGYTSEINNFTYTIDFLYFDYPGEQGAPTPELAYYEYGGSLSYTFTSDMEPTIGASLFHTPEFYAETGKATAIEATFGLSLPMGIGLGVVYGNQQLEAKYNDINGYAYYGVALSKSIGVTELTVGYSDTDSDGDTYQGSKTNELFITLGASI